ncbi:MAG: hypothetical protein GWP74_18505, partial [Proteobacteria bacterium]|nr:hypothetical protein [Pseudomonadota bacterium]
DMIVDHHSSLADKSATAFSRRDDLERLLREAPPGMGSDPESVLATL